MGISGAQLFTEGLFLSCLFQHPGSFKCQLLKLTRVLWDTPLSLNCYILFASKSLGFHFQKYILSMTTPSQPSGSTSLWTLSCSLASASTPGRIWLWPDHLDLCSNPLDGSPSHPRSTTVPDHPALGRSQLLAVPGVQWVCLFQGLCTNRASEGTSAQMLTGLVT